LEHLGLVRIRQGDGTRVQNFMETAGIELVRHLVPLAGSMDPAIIRDVLEFRQVIGREVARLAADRRTPNDLAVLREIAERAADPQVELGRMFGIDFEFYVALTAATQNRVMVLLINTVRDAVAEYSTLLAHLTVTAAQVVDHHRELIAALEAKDPAAAAASADRYLGAGANHVRKLIGAGAIPP
ncbi:MAG TPA: FCD domain-containing protein, partial [Kofleriaceae bacterium]|nr:FCD domain-containing protein [Kofleriaceae bacterium]